MKNRKRIMTGIKNVINQKWKIIFPILYLCIIYLTWDVGKNFIPECTKFFPTQTYIWLFNIFMVEVALIGTGITLAGLGTPVDGKRIEAELLENGFVDKMGETPLLLLKKKEKNGMIYEFYSKRIPYSEYEKNIGKIEMALNSKVIAVDIGKDMRHVVIKAISNEKSFKETMKWKEEYLVNDDFVLKLGENFFEEETIDLSITPHMLIGGGSGSGKSSLLKLVLYQCVRKGADVYIADFKGGIDYSGIWHEKCSVVVKPEEFLDVLIEAMNILKERQQILSEVPDTSIKEYNQTRSDKLRRIVIVCDEVAQVLNKKEELRRKEV